MGPKCFQTIDKGGNPNLCTITEDLSLIDKDEYQKVV